MQYLLGNFVISSFKTEAAVQDPYIHVIIFCTPTPIFIRITVDLKKRL